jgi:hypothetical protein
LDFKVYVVKQWLTSTCQVHTSDNFKSIRRSPVQ